MLALVAVLAAALLGMAAMTVDIGYATMQQQRLEAFAEASAMAALREEARVRFAMDRDPSMFSGLECDKGTQLESCIDSRVASATVVEGMYGLLLPGETGASTGLDGAEVSLGPSAPIGGPRPCDAANPRCWESEIVQSLPLLFAQGSMLGFEDGTLREMMQARADGDVLAENQLELEPTLRTQGIGVRGVSRVETRPVVRVGAEEVPLAESVNGTPYFLPGRAPFALRLDVWNSVPQGFSGPGLRLQVNNDDGLLSRIGEADVGVTGRRLGDGEALRAGQILVGSVDWTALSPSPGVYVPLFVVLEGSNEELVVGFGFADVAVDVQGGLQITVTPLGSQLSLGNATASPRLWVQGEGGDEVVQRIDTVLALRENDGLFLHAPVFR